MLHVAAEPRVHQEFVYLPQDAQRIAEAKGKEAGKERCDVQCCFRVLMEDVGEDKAEEGENDAGLEMEHAVPKDVLGVEVAHLAQEKGGKDKDRKGGV